MNRSESDLFTNITHSLINYVIYNYKNIYKTSYLYLLLRTHVLKYVY